MTKTPLREAFPGELDVCDVCGETFKDALRHIHPCWRAGEDIEGELLERARRLRDDHFELRAIELAPDVHARLAAQLDRRCRWRQADAPPPANAREIDEWWQIVPDPDDDDYVEEPAPFFDEGAHSTFRLMLEATIVIERTDFWPGVVVVIARSFRGRGHRNLDPAALRHLYPQGGRPDQFLVSPETHAEIRRELEAPSPIFQMLERAAITTDPTPSVMARAARGVPQQGLPAPRDLRVTRTRRRGGTPRGPRR